MDYVQQTREVDNLFNLVHELNDSAMVWLRWLGFKIGPIQPYGPMGAQFYPFYKGPHWEDARCAIQP
jgi:hypothetical protein